MKKKQTDRAFFEYLYQTYEQKIYHLAYSILHQKEQAEDITQDVFVHLYQTCDNLQTLDDTHLNYLILQITKYKAIDLYRKNSNQLKYLEKQQQAEQIKSSHKTENVLQDLVSEEQFETITQELKDPYLKVFIYRIFYHFSTKEIAQMMSTKEATVRKQFERAKNKVQSILGGVENE